MHASGRYVPTTIAVWARSLQKRIYRPKRTCTCVDLVEVQVRIWLHLRELPVRGLVGALVRKGRGKEGTIWDAPCCAERFS